MPTIKNKDVNMDEEWLDPEKVDKKNARQFLLLLRHLKAYDFAGGHLNSGTDVLEIGSGAGYGAKILSTKANRIICIDLNHDALKVAKMNNTGNIYYLVANPTKQIPFPDGYFDLIIFFQVIEHIAPSEVNFFLEEVRRVKSHAGKALISTPNRTLRLLPFQKPWNKYHKKEYSHRKFKKILNKVFTNVDIYGLIAKKEIIELERISVKQRPLAFYIKTPLIMILKKCFPIFSLNLLKSPVRLFKTNKKPLSKNGESDTSNTEMSLNDLHFSKEEIKNALDFIAVCTH